MVTTPDERAARRDAMVRQRIIDLLRLHSRLHREDWSEAKARLPGLTQDTQAVLSMASAIVVRGKRPSLASAVDTILTDPAGFDMESPAGRALERAHSLLSVLSLRWACIEIAKREARRCRQ